MDELYRDEILDRYKHPRFRGHLADADAQGERVNPVCGDHIIVELAITDGIISEACFSGLGCAISQAAADLGSEAIIGQQISALPDDRWILDLLGITLSTARRECGLLWLKAVRDALA
jgi:nitrogen fixation NifU-like protein